MGVLPDWMIEREIKIDPFSPSQVRPGVISFGCTAYGYDLRCGYKFKVFTNAFCGEVDPKAFDPRAFVSVDVTPGKVLHNWEPPGTGRPARCRRCGTTATDGPDGTIGKPCPEAKTYVRVPPNSFALAESVEHISIPRGVLAVCVGKSTYARCGIIVNVTPLEPEWRGKVTLEISNTTPLPARIYAGEGLCQVIFLRSDGLRAAALDTVRGLLRHQQDRKAPGPGLIEDQLHSAMTGATCRVSYEDRRGRYQDQTGLTLPTVDR